MFRYTVGTIIGGILVATVMTGIVSFFVTAINTDTFPPIPVSYTHLTLPTNRDV